MTWWQILLLIICIPITVLIAYCLLFIITSVIVPKKEYNKNSRYYRWLLNSITDIGMIVGRIHMHAEGMDKIPDERFLLVSNHRSKMDPIIAWHIFKKYDVAFISKKENFKIPFFGHIICKCCFMTIDREDPRKAVYTVNRAVDLIKNNEVSVGVYPEGTRNYGEGLLPFHNAMFKIAQKANVPIVVFATKNTDEIARRFPWKGTHVYMKVTRVIPAETVKSMKTNEIGEIIVEDILKFRGEKIPDKVVGASTIS